MKSKDNNKDIQDSAKFFHHFIEFISDCSDLENPEIDKELRSQGIDIANLIIASQGIVENALEEDRLAWQKEAKAKRELNLEKIAKKKIDLSRLKRIDLIARIKSFSEALEPDFSFAHRNLKLEDMSEDELRDIISEYDQLADE